MEDILASIRRILSEEDVPAAPPSEEPEQEPDVLLLDSSMLVAELPPTPKVVETAASRSPRAGDSHRWAR